MKEAIRRFKESLFFSALKLIKLNKKLFFLTLVFDFLFIAVFYYSSQFISSLITARATELMEFLTLPLLSMMFAFFFSIAYILLLVLIYSFFKYCVLDLIKSMTQETEFNFKRFGRFYLLNLVICVFISLIFMLISILLSSTIKQQFIPIAGLVIFIPFGLVFYSFLNFSHSYFILKPMPTKAILKQSLKKASKLSSYYKVYLVTFLYSLIFVIIYYLLALLFKTIFSQKSNFLSYYSVYIKIFTVIILIVIYLIIAYNRVYFYLNIKEAKQ